MNYRHLFHAGNFADVAKHVALVGLMLHLRKKETPFAVIDSHAGRGLYDLASVEARTTGEAGGGIERLHGDDAAWPASLRTYLGIVRPLLKQESAPFYPGSPVIAAKLLRSQDRLVAVEKHKDEAAELARALAPFRNASAEHADGYARMRALLPPGERRGIVLVDPPFEAADEFETMATAIHAACRRFATGIYLVWFPVKSAGAADAFCGEALNAGAAKALRLDIAIRDTGEGRLTRAGLLLLNPPYGFAAEMRAAFGVLEPQLEAQTEMRWLMGGDD